MAQVLKARRLHVNWLSLIAFPIPCKQQSRGPLLSGHLSDSAVHKQETVTFKSTLKLQGDARLDCQAKGTFTTPASGISPLWLSMKAHIANMTCKTCQMSGHMHRSKQQGKGYSTAGQFAWRLLCTSDGKPPKWYSRVTSSRW